MPRAPLLSSSIAVCTASVVTPAPPTAGRKVKICASVRLGRGRRLGDARAGAHQFDRRHRLDQKIGDPHLHQAARDAAVEGLRDATTGGQLPIRSISRSSAASSASSAASTSATTTVAPATSISPRSRRAGP